MLVNTKTNELAEAFDNIAALNVNYANAVYCDTTTELPLPTGSSVTQSSTKHNNSWADDYLVPIEIEAHECDNASIISRSKATIALHPASIDFKVCFKSV